MFFNEQVILGELVEKQSGYRAGILIITMTVIFIAHACYGNGMPRNKNSIDVLVIMGNHGMSHNHQPAENERRGFNADSCSQMPSFCKCSYF